MPADADIMGGLAAITLALGVLFLVLGAAIFGYSSYEKTDRAPARIQHDRIVWLVFVGLVAAMVSALFSLLGAWLGHINYSTVVLIVLFASFGSVLLAALVLVFRK